MDESQAKQILKLSLALDIQFAELDTLISKLDENARTRFLKPLGDLVGAVNVDFIMPILEEFPGLRVYVSSDLEGNACPTSCRS